MGGRVKQENKQKRMKANLSQNVTTLVDEVPLLQNISEQVHYTFWFKLASIYNSYLFIYNKQITKTLKHN